MIKSNYTMVKYQTKCIYILYLYVYIAYDDRMPLNILHMHVLLQTTITITDEEFIVI